VDAAGSGGRTRRQAPWRVSARHRHTSTTLAHLTVGIDFGGTNIKLGLVDPQGRVVTHGVLPTHEFTSPTRLVTGLAQRIQELAAGHGVRVSQLKGAGMGVPGLVDRRRGIVHQLVNVPGRWREVPLAGLLQRRLGRPCAVDNDVNVVALGEWRFGAGRGTRDSVYVTLGTGVGGSLVVNGGLVRGVSGSAGEIGHIVVDIDGPACACGSRGCLEALIGTKALLRNGRAAIARRPSSLLARWVRREHRALTPALLSDAAKAGDAGARRTWQEAGRVLGVGLASVINVLNPERIVLGGGVANAWRWFAPSMRQAIRAHAFAVPARAARVVPAALGSNAGVVGGAVLVWDHMRGGT
jgi:glucokinase